MVLEPYPLLFCEMVDGQSDCVPSFSAADTFSSIPKVCDEVTQVNTRFDMLVGIMFINFIMFNVCSNLLLPDELLPVVVVKHCHIHDRLSQHKAIVRLGWINVYRAATKPA